MLGNWHVRCGAGEKLEIISKVYLLQTFVEDKLERKNEGGMKYVRCWLA